MNTQTHVIMGAALFGGKIPKTAWAAALGGLLPDVPMIIIVGALKFYGVYDIIIFGFLYWQNWWQLTNAIAHNFWGWGGLLLFSVIMRERRTLTAAAIDRWSLPVAFAASGLLHVGVDFLVHREDAHMSLWPVTRWKFISPVSYYDPQHYGHYVAGLEALLGLALATILIRRFRNKLVRVALAVAMVMYAVVPAYFILG
jgi:membrane-bound metal-dependent hydrolase YbcI (DUF457 family)